MKEIHPKRRKDKFNPYKIYRTEDGKCHLSFCDGEGISHHLELDEILYALFDRFELDDLSYLNVVDRHYEHSELTEISLNNRAFLKEESLEEQVLKKLEMERLHRAISQLPEIQRRRIIFYYFENLTYEQIAMLEGCTITPIKNSIDKALKNLKKILEKGE